MKYKNAKNHLPCTLIVSANSLLIASNTTAMCQQAVMAEWLRRLTRNQMGSSRVGQNPTHSGVTIFKIGYIRDTKDLVIIDSVKENVRQKEKKYFSFEKKRSTILP